MLLYDYSTLQQSIFISNVVGYLGLMKLLNFLLILTFIYEWGQLFIYNFGDTEISFTDNFRDFVMSGWIIKSALSFKFMSSSSHENSI